MKTPDSHVETTAMDTKRARVTWRKEPSTSGSPESAHVQQPAREGDAPPSDDTGMPRFGEAPTDPQLTERESRGLSYPAGTNWTAFTDDELERFVEYLFERIGSCEVEMYAWGQVGGGGWFGAYYFALARLRAIEAHRGAEWLDPIAVRLRAHWDDVIAMEKAGMEAWDLAKDRAAGIFPNNAEAREALVEIMGREWRRQHGIEDASRCPETSE